MAQLLKSLETEVPAIDAANDCLRFLLERMFQQGVECRKGVDGKGACDYSRCSRIDSIIRFLSRNFARQEQVMTASDYPEAPRHAAEHAALLDGLATMRDAHVCADKDSDKVRDYVSLWAADHAKRSDQSLGRWAVTRRLAEPIRG